MTRIAHSTSFRHLSDWRQHSYAKFTIALFSYVNTWWAGIIGGKLNSIRVSQFRNVEGAARTCFALSLNLNKEKILHRTTKRKLFRLGFVAFSNIDCYLIASLSCSNNTATAYIWTACPPTYCRTRVTRKSCGKLVKMKILTVLASIFVLCVNTLNVEDLHLKQEWSDFKIKFNRTYGNSSEEQKRFEVFETNFEKIKAHNELYDVGKESFKLGINRYGDLTYPEIVQIHTPNKTDDEWVVAIHIRNANWKLIAF